MVAGSKIYSRGKECARLDALCSEPGGARKKTPAWGEAGVNRRMGEGLGGWDTPSGAVAQPTLCRPFCSDRMCAFSVPEKPLRSLGSIVHALIIRGTDLFLHRYRDDGAARAADRKSHNPT